MARVRGGWALDRDDLYAQAGAGPTTWISSQTYDDYPVIVVMQIEDLGFCAKGEGAGLRPRATPSRIDGSSPAQHLGRPAFGRARPARRAASSGMVEAIRQLTGQAGGARR